MTKAKMIEFKTQKIDELKLALSQCERLIDRYETVLSTIATMLDNGITAQHGAKYTWDRWADHSTAPPEINDEVSRSAWIARKKANAALCFEQEESGVEG